MGLEVLDQDNLRDYFCMLLDSVAVVVDVVVVEVAAFCLEDCPNFPFRIDKLE